MLKDFLKSKLFVILALTLIPATSFADGVFNPAMNGYDAGVIDNNNIMQMKEMEAKKKLDRDEKLDIENNIKLKEEIDKLPNKEVSFVLHSVSFQGNTVYTDEELIHLICHKIDTEVTINDLIAYCNLITDYYQQAGYLSSIAYMPPQRVQDGNIEIIITEGKYGNVTFTGNKWARDKYIQKQFLDDNNIIHDEIVNIKDIQEALRQVNSTGYMQGSVALSDNEESFEYTDVELQLKDRFPIDIDLRFDDQGRNETGLLRGVLFAGMYNLTGFGDKLLSTSTFARHSFAQGIFYTVPIATHETKLNLGYSYSGVRPQVYIDGVDLDFRGRSHNFFAGLSRRLIKTENYKLYGDITFDIRNTSSWSEKYAKTFDSSYKTRAIRLNLTNIKDDFYGKWFGNAGVSFGMPIFGAHTHTDDRLPYFHEGSDEPAGYSIHYRQPSSKFVKFNASLARIQLLPLNSMLILQANGQYAGRGLYASEQMSFGGISSVRGYQESDLLADSGLTASAELRFPIPFLGMILPENLKFIDDSIRLAAFYDIGWLSHSYNNAVNSGGRYQTAIMGAGGGLVIKMTKYLSGNVYFGIPIGGKPDNHSNFRVHFTVTSNIL